MISQSAYKEAEKVLGLLAVEPQYAKLEVAACRRQRPYSRLEYLGRVLWALSMPLFRWSPRPFFGWRCFLLRMFGAKVGHDVHVYPSAIVYLPWNLVVGDEASIGEWALIYNLGKIIIGERATVSHRAHLCAGTHDYRHPTLPLIRDPIDVGAQAWICADAFIGPGLKIGEGAIVGAAAVVTKDIPAWQIVAGNPARIVKMRVMYSPEELSKHGEF